MLLYIVRHGIPDYATDSLTPAGQAQAQAVARRLCLHGIDAIYSSPKGRARQTAQPTAEALGLPVQIEPFMSEDEAWNRFHCVRADGRGGWAFWQREKILSTEDAYTDPRPFSRGLYQDDENAAAGFRALGEASDAFLARLGYTRTGEGNAYRVTDGNDRRIAAFCHQGFGLHWLAYLLHFPVSLFTASFDISHTGITVLRFQDEGNGQCYPMCLCLSDLSHIYGDGLPLRYHDQVDL